MTLTREQVERMRGVLGMDFPVEAVAALCATALHYMDERDRLREALVEWWSPNDPQRPRHEPNCGACRGCRTDAALAGVKDAGENDAASGGDVAPEGMTCRQDVAGISRTAEPSGGNESRTQAATPASSTLTRDDLRALVEAGVRVGADLHRTFHSTAITAIAARVLDEWERGR